MKHCFAFLLSLVLLFSLASCKPADTGEGGDEGIPLTDSLGNTVTLPPGARVVAGYASFAECWLLSGGTLVGVTEDAISEHGLDVGEEVAIVGTVKEINTEALVALSPDYVILSADLAAHHSLGAFLETLGIPHGFFCEDSFRDYKELMSRFCAVNGREDLYRTHVVEVEEEIASILSRVPQSEMRVLLMRVYSTGMKAKGADNPAGQILSDFGLTNLAGSEVPAELSMEYIVAADPELILAVPMGNEEGALAYLAEHAESHPAWGELTAVKNGRWQLLPKELFHHKPNQRWGESYAYLANLIWPQIFANE